MENDKFPSVERKKFHILSTNKQKYIPSHIIFFDAETKGNVVFKKKNTKAKNEVELTQETLRLAFYEYWIDGKFEREEFFYSKEYFFNMIQDTFLGLRKTLYIFAHNTAFDFRVSLDNEFFEFNYDKILDIIDGNHFILIFKHKKTKRKIVFLDSFNYFKTSIEKLGEELGIDKIPIKDFDNVATEYLKLRCMIDVEILRRTIFELFDFIKENNVGSFKYTIAGLSFNGFRHSFMKDTIYIHANEKAHKLERKSYFGGRTECFFIGKLNTPVIKLDINSAYSKPMRDEYFPTKLIRVLHNPTLEYVKDLRKKYLIIADVLVKTDKRFYPKKIDNKIVFPIGTFRTSLCSPELFYDYSNIKKIFSICVYEKAKIFTDYIKYFYNKRMEYKEKDNKIYTYFCKIYSHSLYGKFGQKNNIVKRNKDFDKYYKKEGYEDIFIKDIHYNVKFSDKKAYVNIGDYEYFNNFVAIASFVTSHARISLLKYMLMNGFKILYVDTDSLFVKKKYSKVYEKYLNNYKLGYLKIEDEGNELEIRGLKDYVFNGEEKIKGLPHKKAKRLSESEIEKLIDEGLINISKNEIGKLKNNVYTYNRFLGYKESFRFLDLKAVYRKDEIKILKRDYKKGTKNKDGIVEPLELTHE